MPGEPRDEALCLIEGRVLEDGAVQPKRVGCRLWKVHVLSVLQMKREQPRQEGAEFEPNADPLGIAWVAEQARLRFRSSNRHECPRPHARDDDFHATRGHRQKLAAVATPRTPHLLDKRGVRRSLVST